MRLIDLSYYFNNEENYKDIVFGIDNHNPYYWVGYNFSGDIYSYWSDNDVISGISCGEAEEAAIKYINYHV